MIEDSVVDAILAPVAIWRQLAAIKIPAAGDSFRLTVLPLLPPKSCIAPASLESCLAPHLPPPKQDIPASCSEPGADRRRVVKGG